MITKRANMSDSDLIYLPGRGITMILLHHAQQCPECKQSRYIYVNKQGCTICLACAGEGQEQMN
jgi:hypothetical protein